VVRFLTLDVFLSANTTRMTALPYRNTALQQSLAPIALIVDVEYRIPSAPGRLGFHWICRPKARAEYDAAGRLPVRMTGVAVDISGPKARPRKRNQPGRAKPACRSATHRAARQL